MIKISDGREKFVTYFDRPLDEFSKDFIQADLFCESSINKPALAWWGSPVNAKFGWKEWCEGTDYEYDFSNPIYWSMETGSKVFTVDWIDIKSNSLTPYVKMIYGSYCLDYQKMKNDGIDAVQLLEPCIGHTCYNSMEMMFNSWDCESIVVLNPEKIVITKQERKPNGGFKGV